MSSYSVWKRNDGYIGVSCGSSAPLSWPGVSFELLKVFDSWGMGIVEYIEEQRKLSES